MSDKKQQKGQKCAFFCLRHQQSPTYPTPPPLLPLQGSLFDLLGEAGLELMMELIDKAPQLAQIDARDLFAIADAHGSGGGGFDGSGGLAAQMSEMGLGEETPAGGR